MPAAALRETEDVSEKAPPASAGDLIRIGVDGSVTLDPSLTPDAASRLFWDHLAARATGYSALIRAAAFREASGLIMGEVRSSRAEIAAALIARAEAEERRALT